MYDFTSTQNLKQYNKNKHNSSVGGTEMYISLSLFFFLIWVNFFNWIVFSDKLKPYTVVYTVEMLLSEQVALDTILQENKIHSSLKYFKATVLCFITDYLCMYYHYYFLEKERSLFLFCLFRRVSARQPEVSGACAVWSSGERPDTQTCLWVTLQLFIFAINR